MSIEQEHRQIETPKSSSGFTVPPAPDPATDGNFTSNQAIYDRTFFSEMWIGCDYMYRQAISAHLRWYLPRCGPTDVMLGAIIGE